MKDNIYNQFKRDISKLHRQGFQMNYPNQQDYFAEEERERGVYIELTFFKKVKRMPKWA